MDSEAIETLLYCMNQIAQNDGSVRVSGMSPEAEIFLELTRMDSVFAMFKEQPAPSLPAALPDFAPSAMRDDMQVSAA
jgi:anti-anti-sigma regulatory factor